MIATTLIVGMIAVVLAAPIGIATAIFLSEYLGGWHRKFFKTFFELLGTVPSVIYGLIGASIISQFLLTPLSWIGGSSGDSVATAGVILGIMILPTIITFSDDALRCVPFEVRKTGLSLGLNRHQVIRTLVFPQAFLGINSAVMLGLGRALGETIAVSMVIGRSDQNFSFSNLNLDLLTKGGQTLTTKLGGPELSLAYGDQKHWSALMAIAVFLWLLVTIIHRIGSTKKNLGTLNED